MYIQRQKMAKPTARAKLFRQFDEHIEKGEILSNISLTVAKTYTAQTTTLKPQTKPNRAEARIAMMERLELNTMNPLEKAT